MLKPRIDITADQLRTHCDYNPETGAFTRRESHRRWKAGTVMAGTESHGYTLIWLMGKQRAAHRLAWLWMTGAWPSQDIDHIDGNRSNNCWANLRHVDRSTNLENLRTAKTNNRSTGLLGAYPSTPGRYTSRIQVRGVDKYLGCFGSPEEAHAAYLSAKREFHTGNTL